jgi:anti-sigma factor RsiW
MKHEDAKLILQACRPGDEAAADPQLAAALALAKTDPELGAWFAREQQWDARIRRELNTVPVPADLKAHILAGQRLVALPVANERPGLFSWRSPVIWAMAATVIFFLGFAFTWSPPQPARNLADFADAMILASPVDAHHVDVDNSNLQQVKAWLAERHAVADIDLPPAIKNAPGLMGCRIMNWQGRSVSMLCFMMNGTQHVDLFVTSASNLADAPPPGTPRFAMVDQQMTAGWSDGGNVYLMTGKVPEEFLRHCLDPSASAQISRPVTLAAAD